MPIPVFALVLLSSFLHASWNYLAKTIPGDTAFVWLMGLVMSVVLLPFSIGYVVLYGFEWSSINIMALAGASILHLLYFVGLQKGYQAADLSVVYPLSRGSGPVFSTLGAVLFLGEQVTTLGLGGLFLVAIGVLLIAGIGQKSSDIQKRNLGIFYGLGIGILIATYTIWDGYAVKILLVAPLLLEYTAHPFRVILLSPVAYRRWPEIREIWRQYHWKILTISFVSPVAFILVLYAMRIVPVHVVAPAREMSIVFGVIFGAKFLTEENFLPRLIGSLLILAGIVLLAV